MVAAIILVNPLSLRPLHAVHTVPIRHYTTVRTFEKLVKERLSLDDKPVFAMLKKGRAPVLLAARPTDPIRLIGGHPIEYLVLCNASGFLVDQTSAFCDKWKVIKQSEASKVPNVGKFQAQGDASLEALLSFQEELQSLTGLLARFRKFMVRKNKFDFEQDDHEHVYRMAIISMWAAFESFLFARARTYADAMVKKLGKLGKTVLVVQYLSDHALGDMKKSDTFKGKIEDFRAFLEKEAGNEDEEQRRDLREFILSFLEEKIDMEFSPHFSNVGSSMSVHEYIDYFCPGEFLPGENISLLVPSMDSNKHQEKMYEVPWNDSLILIRYFYGFRCVVGHGDADVTFSQRGILSSVPEIVSRTSVLETKENYLQWKLQKLRNEHRKFKPGSDFTLLMSRFLAKFAYSFHQQLLKITQAFCQ